MEKGRRGRGESMRLGGEPVGSERKASKKLPPSPPDFFNPLAPSPAPVSRLHPTNSGGGDAKISTASNSQLATTGIVAKHRIVWRGLAPQIQVRPRKDLAPPPPNRPLASNPVPSHALTKMRSSSGHDVDVGRTVDIMDSV